MSLDPSPRVCRSRNRGVCRFWKETVSFPEKLNSHSAPAIQGDWPWHGNRHNPALATYSKSSAWHNFRGQTRFNMLFGDGHVESFAFLKDYRSWDFSPAPDPNFRWW